MVLCGVIVLERRLRAGLRCGLVVALGRIMLFESCFKACYIN